MLLNRGVGEDCWESLGLQVHPVSPSWRKSVLGVHWKDWCWSWNSNTLATWCEVLTYLKRPWCWERLRAGGEGDDRGWDGWIVSLTQWTWLWVDSGTWWWQGGPACCGLWGGKKSDMTEWLKWNELGMNLACVNTCHVEALVESRKCESMLHMQIWNWFPQLCKESVSFWKRGLFGLKCRGLGTFLVVQWLRICLPMQGTQVWSLVQKPTPAILQGN